MVMAAFAPLLQQVLASRGGQQVMQAGMSLVGRKVAGGGRATGDGTRRRRTRSLYVRKGRLFMGYSQKEVKTAMRRSYGGKR